jgi:hypothetical protein
MFQDFFVVGSFVIFQYFDFENLANFCWANMFIIFFLKSKLQNSIKIATLRIRD